MKKIKEFRVVPYLPEKIKPLLKIAYNLWWVWDYEAIDLFRRLDVDLWRETEHNPIKFLGLIPQLVLEQAAESESFIAHMERVENALNIHLTRKSWYDHNIEKFNGAGIAYFSAEFGIHECLPVYSGGLGVLAGDHLKSASELGLPFCGVGLMYRLGYFRQYLNLDGWQQEKYPENDFYNIPISLVEESPGKALLIDVDLPGRKVYARVWKALVGRVNLYLLDANIDENSLEDRAITDQLYGGDIEMRIKQEIMLGIGGTRALKKMGINITVYHMNEGHAAFLALERIRVAMEEDGMSFNEAHEFVTSSNIFTTHTPVPAGNDRFEPELIVQYFADFYKQIGLERERFLALGRENPFDKKEKFCMTVLALKTAFAANGVSRLHGHVSRNMWSNVWKGIPENEIPVGHVTNGIQTMSWTSDEMMGLFHRYLGPAWVEDPTSKKIWERIDNIPDSELWRCRERLRERLVGFSRRRLRQQLLSRGVPTKYANVASSVLDPEALTIGFARRFATYKRATLIFRDIDRLNELLSSVDKPVQIVFSGKAHPKDNLGKELIKNIIHLSRDEKLRKKVVFLEDYDINVARYLVQGVDVWLNNPIRPKEASGTSGMKVVANGGLNISVLDGWWDEAYNSNNGWAVGNGEVYDDPEYQDEVESLSVYNILEEEVVPLFYKRGEDDLPVEWLAKIRASMKSIIPEFNTNRMVKDYAEKYYQTGHQNYSLYSVNSFKLSREMAEWKEGIKQKWSDVEVLDFSFDHKNDILVGSKVMARAVVKLGLIDPDEVMVELFFGSIDSAGNITDGVAAPMYKSGEKEKGVFIFEGQMLCLNSGKFGYSVRVKPYKDNMVRKFDPELPLTWA